MLGWCLYLLIALKMGSVMSLCLSIIYGFSLICSLLVLFLKKLFSSSDTTCSSDIIFSFSSRRAILLLILSIYNFEHVIVVWDESFLTL